MSEAEECEAPFTITLKGSEGYEAPWVVIRANTAADAVARLAEAQADGLLDRVAEYSAAFQAKLGAAPAPRAGTPSPEGAAPTDIKAAIAQATSPATLQALWKQYRNEWTEEYTNLATARKTVLEGEK